MSNFHALPFLIIFSASLHLCLSSRDFTILESQCTQSGFLVGRNENCNKEDGSSCCQAGRRYPQYHCSPEVTGETKAVLTLNSFEEGGSGGGPSECDGRFHSDHKMVVALSTGWYDEGRRCLKNIRINGNGRSVVARVVDECDSVRGCDSDHDFQPPCHNNIVDASPAVWNALGITENDGDYRITWSDE